MAPRLTFHGAARAVTGSCFRLQVGGAEVLFDCGLFQGSKTEKALNYRPFPFAPARIAAVVLSHAHIDHSGLLPKLVRDGFAGPIHATPATIDLAGVMLPDSAHIQEIEVEQLNRRRARHGERAVEPIYTGADAQACLKRFVAHAYGEWFDLAPGVRARFWNAGHLLGSASIEVEVAEVGAPLRLLLSADIGPEAKLLQPEPEGPSGIDYLLCESTYGDRVRPPTTDESRRAALRDEVRAAIHPNGALLIPSFAVERAQELIADLAALMATDALPEIPIYVDSPLAARATQVFARHASALEGGAALRRALASRHLHFTQTAEQSMALDRVHGFHIVIAASGMCEAGRIRHRLKNWLWRDEATVLLVGFQAAGTLGRLLQDGAPSVRIQGESFEVRARIRTLDLYSGHADAGELVAWVRARLPIARDVFLVHGEEPAIEALAGRLSPFVDPGRIVLPVLDEGFELTHAGARRLAEAPAPRIRPEQVARLDWHNDVSRLFLDINAALAAAADERSRNVLVRRLRRVLDEEAQAGPH
ncbi:MBL fold metallo-hydrolase [Amaricoccus sp.]|uniref:MBL fold metallo-hydrolase n=1 Tax=Amaricoccus sp. TaxID=1872485 RepID=UPI002CA0D574|nr:MBL fold metallo-hydrolase [Amaricoccus sp.]HRW15294.1 MBL fold metallo-hydrolase [Amaricoccus sp.]